MSLAFIRNTFLRGLVAVLPLVISVYLALWLIGIFESVFRPVILLVLPQESYLTGMGVFVGVVGIFLVGLLLRILFARKIWSFGELVVSRMPVFSQVYDALKQIASFMGGKQQPAGSTAVLVKLGEGGARMLGLVTREDVEFASETPESRTVAVFLPWSYQIGGITVLVPMDRLEPVELATHEALRFSFTAGIEAKPDADESPQRIEP